ncbi:MAG: winged helix-turn-helix domain-containing protein [Deltaproteobacteria bacterium]|nr:winged helix-turn-helix domain-containing protein [Deltaproteobacteria bacterium]
MFNPYILLADNDSDFLNTRAEFLENAGYQVLKALTLAEAERLLREAYVHLAILDIRMENDDDEKDVSGLILAKDPAFRPVPKIMLTGFPTTDAVRESLRVQVDGLQPAVDFLEKKEGPEAMTQVVERTFEQCVRINQDLRIRWDEREPLSFPYLVNLIEPELPAERLPDRAGELEDLFRKLFYDKSQITIGRHLWHQGGRVCLAVFAYSPQGVSEQRVVTCGIRPQIEQEIARYREFAPKGGVGTALVGFAETMHFAAIACDLHEADLEQVQTFETFYRTNKAAQIGVTARYFLQATLAAWHQEGRILEETKCLSHLYRERLSLSQETVQREELQRRMQALAREALSLGPTTMELSAKELTLRFPNGDSVSYPNPIPHLYDEGSNGQPVICRITPGTLSGDNILVDQKGQTWLTDFAQAGPASLLWDFVSLEAIIRFDLVDSANLQALCEFERRLVNPSRLNERLDTQDIDPQFRKALGVIQEIRRLAFHSAGGDPIPYYEGLVFCAMSDAAGYITDLKHTRQKLAHLVHAFLAAAMICARIAQITGNPSLEGFSSDESGVEIDEVSRQVRVGARWVSLGPLEFDVMLYLYKHAGQLCSRRSIVEEGFKETYYVNNDQQASRINTTMHRLRERIEPNPDDPCYITTVRGKGYMLCPRGEGRS